MLRVWKAEARISYSNQIDGYNNIHHINVK